MVSEWVVFRFKVNFWLNIYNNQLLQVRHECAEALGAIGTPECEQILKEYLKDEKRVVKESCEVALDICEYEMNGNFQYADGLQTVAL